MSWAARRQIMIIGGFLLLVVAVLGWIGFRVFYEAPTCFDGIHNGLEEGIDCGGECEQLCSFQAQAPVVLWDRFFEVTPNVYSAIALIQNPNPDVHAFNVPYLFKLRDERGILIDERGGHVYIPPRHTFAIFETGLATGSRVPKSSFFEFLGTIDWKRTSEEQPDLRVGDVHVQNEDVQPRVSAVLSNPSLDDVQGIYVVAVVLNEEGNALATSQTIVDVLRGETSQELVFTWPLPFPDPPTKVELFPIVPK